MAEIIIMPKLGFNMDEGQLVRWHKAVGERVVKGEILFEINTDKTTMPVEATTDGVLLATLFEQGSFIDVFTPIAVIGAAGEDYSKALADAEHPAVAGDSSAMPRASAPCLEAAPPPAPANGLKLTPKAKKFVAENGVDPACLAQIEGTGYQNGVTAKDIKASPLAKKIAADSGVDLSRIAGSGIAGKVMKADVLEAEQAPAPPQQGDDRRVLHTTPYKGVRRIIGEKLVQSKACAPHLYFTDSVDMTNLTAAREALNKAAEVKIAVSDLLIIAAAKALRKFPAVNSSLVGDTIVTYQSINIGTAVAGDNGLVVPVVKNVQEKSLTEIAIENKDLVSRAKEGRLEPFEYAQGTFTISNLGMFGIENFTAIINYPEAAILSVSSVRKKAVVQTDEDGVDTLCIRPMMNIQLSVDHRLIDGLLAVRFVGYIKHLLENPLEILI